MSRRWFGLAALLVLIAGAAWWLAADRNANGPTVASGEGPRERSAPTAIPSSAPALATAIAAESRVAAAPSAAVGAYPAAAGSFQVQVVEADGRPVAGAGVALAIHDKTLDHVVRVAETRAPDGITEFARPQPLLPPERSWFVRLAAPLENPEEITVDPSALPRDPIRLTMPPTGSVTVFVNDRDGRRVLEPFYSRLSIARTTQEESARRGFLASNTGPHANGHVEYRHVGLGLKLHAGISLEGRRYLNEAIGAGPTAPGENVELTVTANASAPIITARVLDPDGQPLASRYFSGIVVVEGDARMPSGSVNFDTDDAGRFRLEIVEALPANGARRLEFGVASPRSPGRAPDPKVGDAGTLDLSRPLAPGVNDCGDVALRSTPTIVTGVVLDDDGKPVAGARVRLECKVDGLAAETPERWTWKDAPAIADTLRVDDAGKFAVRGKVPPGFLRLSAWKDTTTYPDNPFVFDTSANGVELRLHRAGTIEGSVLLAAGMPLRDVSVEVRMNRSDSQKWVGWGTASSQYPRDDGTFALAPLRTGSYTARVTVARQELARFEDVKAQAGETTRDPRLQKIDLRQARYVTLKVVDASGSAIDGATAKRVGGSPSAPAFDPRDMHSDVQGTMKLLLLEESCDVIVGALGFRPETVHGLKDDLRVTLRRGIPIRVVITEISKLPAPPIEASLGLTLSSERDRQRRDARNAWPPDPGTTTSAAFLRENGAATVEVGLPGEYFVGLQLNQLRDNTWFSSGLATSTRTILVDDAVREQVYTITIEDDAIRESLATLEKMMREQKK